MFLTAEEPEATRAAIADKGLAGTWVVVDPGQWQEWELANAKRQELPLPGTIVVDPQGEVQSVDLFVNYLKRRPVGDTIAQVREDRPRQEVVAAGSSGEGIDFASAVSIRGLATPSGAILYVDVAENFVVYGAKEKAAVPLAMAVGEGAKAKLPPGDPKRTTTGTQRVLTGGFAIPIRARGNPRLVEGTLTYQACYETLCAPPETVDWAIPR